MKSRIDGIGIKAISVAVPANVVDVFDYVKCRDIENIKRVVRKTGITKIRVASDDVTTADLCFEAAEQLFSNGYDKKNICAVIFVSKTPDHIVLPPTSCLIQARLGLDIETLCYDSMAACYGFIGGMELAGLIAKQHDADVLLLTGDTNSRIVSAADSSAVMFGDGGAATIIGSVKDVSIDLHIRNNGAIADVASVKAGGFRYPTTEENLVFHTDQYGNSRNDCHIRMHGLDMMNFVLNDASTLIKETMDSYGGAGAFDVIAFHQPNEMIVKSLAQCLSISLKKIPLYVNGYGNISSASIPLSLSKMLYGNNDKARYLTLMAGFGGGASWGTAVTDLSETEFYPVREV